jgi:hypothetical protein
MPLLHLVHATQWHGQPTTFRHTVQPCIAVNLPLLEAARNDTRAGHHRLLPSHLYCVADKLVVILWQSLMLVHAASAS